MGVLRIKEDVDELVEKDPYDLFTLDEPHRSIRKLRPEFWGAAFIGVLIAFGIAFMTFLNVQQGSRESGESPYAYFEIKAIDPDGRPVAGALVREGERQLGVTDSFGEWRRFMRVRLGSTVMLQIAKRNGGGNGGMSAVKSIAVPAALPASGDLELNGSVQLVRGGTKGMSVARKGGAGGGEQAAEPIPAGMTARADGVEDDEIAGTFDDAAPMTAVAPAPAAVKPAPVAREATVVAAVPAVRPASAPASGDAVAAVAGRDFASVWFMAEGTPSPQLTEVFQALRRRSVELGVKVDPQAAWRIRLRELAVGDTRLIQVEGSHATGNSEERLFTYLRNHQEATLQTARDILWAATVHVSKTHRVRKLGEAWLAESVGPRLWALAPGKTVVDAGSAVYTIVPDASGAGLALSAADTVPCASGTACEIVTPGITRMPPVPGWQRQRVRVLGASADVDVYVSGYEARKLQDKVYEYWGVPAGGANVTATRNGRVIYRGRVQSGGATLPVLTLPSAAISKAGSSKL